MKKLLASLSIISLLATPVIALENQVNSNIANQNQQEKVDDFIKEFHINYQKINQESKNITENLSVNVQDAGENSYYYYFGYHMIYFSHDVTQRIGNAIVPGVGAIAGIIASAIPPAAPLAAVIAAILILQWVVWNIPGYDNGRGVCIEMVGFGIPQYIINVSSQ